VALGVRKEKLRLREHDEDELAHYAKAATDIEYEFPFGWQEVEGIANRTDFDLRRHQEESGEDLTYFDQQREDRYLPWVIEPAAGVDRVLLTFLIDAYREQEAPTAKGGTETRTYLALHKELAPTKVAVLPLSRNEQLVPTAREVFDLLKAEWMCDYDDAGSIGRRYRRQDEVGTPFCLTVDFDSLQDQAVTVRDRDTMTQDRVPLARLVDHLRERL
jgi:glycyl-tRNA synthetase